VKPNKTVSYRSADEYLQEAYLYRLGELPTEARHPDTMSLSQWVQDDLPRASRILEVIDSRAMRVLFDHRDALARLHAAMQDTLERRHRVILCGCGATGRLSLVLESIWKARATGDAQNAIRNASPVSGNPDAVTAFMAGGDIALVRSVENFEDIPEFGARQLHELQFGANDLLVSTTEGGETPFVIGATEEAARCSRRKPWFLHCNPESALRPIERSRRVLDNPGIEKIALACGAMSLSGSTRLQASTVLMLAVGLGLLGGRAAVSELLNEVAIFIGDHEAADFSSLLPLTREEADIYRRGGYVLYETDRYGITVLTDTTERSPTFSLQGFENSLDPGAPPALAYLCLPDASTSEEAWLRILGRLPRGLDWEAFEDRLGHTRALGFDFSIQARAERARRVASAPQARFEILSDERGMRLGLVNHETLFPFPFRRGGRLDDLIEQTLLKLILNRHSLLVMGYLGRYQGNLMTWVRPSNGKLIDRTLRYATHLLRERGIADPGYEALARILFDEMKEAREDEPLVLRVVSRALATSQASIDNNSIALNGA
jgi:N-acetylmuramic acid 6-phosphate etherase